MVTCANAIIAHNESMRKSTLNSPLEAFTRMMFSRVIERLAVVMSEENLSFSQVSALHIIDQSQEISIQELSQRLNLSLSATSRLIDELVKADFLNRIEDPANRRSKIVTLTKFGNDFLTKLSLERVRIIKTTASSLPSTLSSKIVSALNSSKGKST